MPNHSTTRCTVTGPDKDITAFQELIIVSGMDETGKSFTQFDFDKLIPEPATEC